MEESTLRNKTHTKYLSKKTFVAHIEKELGIERPIFDLKATKDPSYLQPWPCAPRKKRYLCPADSVLDLPGYRYTFLPELLDCNSDDVLVAALGQKYYKWSWRTQSLISRGFTYNLVYCCKFDPRGELLALGTAGKKVEIHHNEMNKSLRLHFCMCIKKSRDYCVITALDWSPTGNSFVTGCSRGMLSVFSRAGDLLTGRIMSSKSIMYVRVSPNARYVASLSMDTNYAMVMSWPSLEVYVELDSRFRTQTLTWHPWCSALLAVGSITREGHSTIAIWDIPTCRVRSFTTSPKPCKVDAMLFSHKTGELVLSMRDSDHHSVTDYNFTSRLVVLSGPDTVVDQWGVEKGYIDQVQTMVFSPDGTKLATATIDEDLVIWNFLPEDKRKKKGRLTKNFSAMPVCLDETSFGLSIR